MIHYHCLELVSTWKMHCVCTIKQSCEHRRHLVTVSTILMNELRGHPSYKDIINKTDCCAYTYELFRFDNKFKTTV